MEKKQKGRKPPRAEQRAPWETRHENDTGGPLADNSSRLPDRTAAIEEGSPGEVAPVHGSGFQKQADAVHPVFPSAGEGASVDVDDRVRRRAYQMWQESGSPEGDHERHWLQAERELRDDLPEKR